MILGFILVRPIPLPASELGEAFEMQGDGDGESGEVRVGLLHNTEMDDDEAENKIQGHGRRKKDVSDALDVHGKALFTSVDFWLLFTIMALRMSSSSPYLVITY